MELFHGSRARFTEFDTSFKGTGEAGTIDAIWFTDNFSGARNHARYKCRNGAPHLSTDARYRNGRCSRISANLSVNSRKLRNFCIAISLSGSARHFRKEGKGMVWFSATSLPEFQR